MFKKLLLISFLWICINNSVFANNVALSMQTAIAKYHFNSTSAQTTPIEVDDLVGDRIDPVPEVSIGLNYTLNNHFDWQWHHIALLNQLTLALNFRYAEPMAEGSVYQFQDPSMNNYAFTLDNANKSLLLDALITLFEYDHVATYLIGGVGVEWNKFTYSDAGIHNVTTGNMVLNTQYNTGAVYELGMGLRHELNKTLDVFMEYRYRYLPAQNTGISGFLNGVPLQLAKSITFQSHAQTIGIGINWKL